MGECLESIGGICIISINSFETLVALQYHLIKFLHMLVSTRPIDSYKSVSRNFVMFCDIWQVLLYLSCSTTKDDLHKQCFEIVTRLSQLALQTDKFG